MPNHFCPSNPCPLCARNVVTWWTEEEKEFWLEIEDSEFPEEPIESEENE